MAKKRKSDASRLDEADRLIYSSFCSAANSLSQLYTHAMHKQKLSFHAGERHALEKLYSFLLRQKEDSERVTTGDIFTYIQNELDIGTEEPPASPRLPPQTLIQQLPQSGVPVTSNAFGPGQGIRSVNTDQTKNNVFSNALSSPVRRSLQNYHLSSQGGYSTNNAVTRRGSGSNENGTNQNRDVNPPSSNDTSMDMHADSPDHDSPC